METYLIFFHCQVEGCSLIVFLFCFSENNPVSNRYGPSVTAPMSNGPIGQSSPYLGRRTFDPRDEQQFYNYNRQYNY